MFRLLLLLFCLTLAGEAVAQGPVPLSTSPLVPVTTDAGPGWRVTRAIPSPDCDYAVELLKTSSYPAPASKSYRWQAGDRVLEENIDLSYPGSSGDSFAFHYTRDGGMFPIIEGYSGSIPPNGSGSSGLHRVGGPGLQTLYYGGLWVSPFNQIEGGVDRVIPRAGKLPLYTFWERRRIDISLPIFRTTYKAYNPDTSTFQTILPQEILTHDSTGALAGFAVIGGRLGETVRGSATLALREPTIAMANTTVHAAGISASRHAALLSGLRFVTWDASTSETVVLHMNSTKAETFEDSTEFRFCEPIGADLWLVGLNGGRPYVWAVSGGKGYPCPLPAEATSFSSWHCDFSDPSAPLLCFVMGSPLGALKRHILVGAKWDVVAEIWSVVPLAEHVSASGTPIRIPRIGRNAAGVATVCFEGTTSTTPSSTRIYSVALDGAGPRLPLPVTGENWIVQ